MQVDVKEGSLKFCKQVRQAGVPIMQVANVQACHKLKKVRFELQIAGCIAGKSRR